MNRQRKGLLIALLALVLAVSLFAIRQLRPPSDAVVEQWLPLIVTADCDSAQQACVARGEGLIVELRLGPAVIPMQPFSIQLRVVQGRLDATAQVELQFQMQGMDMGQNRYRLLADESGLWRGTAVLPVCSRGRSDWLARLAIQDGDRQWSAMLPFTAVAQ